MHRAKSLWVPLNIVRGDVILWMEPRHCERRWDNMNKPTSLLVILRPCER